MIFDYEPGDYVINPKNKEWGTGQIQSIIKNIVTVNFENAGKKTIIADKVLLEKINVKNLNNEFDAINYEKSILNNFASLITQKLILELIKLNDY